MSSQLKISADTSQVKKSILDLSKSLKDIKGSKVTIFNAEDKKFLKTELKKELALMKSKLKENRVEISKLVEEQMKQVSGSQDELEIRKKILDAYKTQAKIGRDISKVQSAQKGGIGGGGGMESMMGSPQAMLGKLALLVAGFGLVKTVQATGQYVSGTPNRNRLKGLGVFDENFGRPEELARSGLTEQDMVQRRVDATSVLGRQGTNNETEMRKASFERSFGLESGTMTGIAGQFRGTMGGRGATDAQMKLQASVFAAGIEDAIGPYLQSATDLLTKINENGMSQTEEITGLLAQMTKDGERTPEMIAKTFEGLNDSIKGAQGESSAFIQTAFARGGIGGGTLGGTKFAMSSGGLMGLSRSELEKRGYNPQLLGQMEKSGLFKGAGDRATALLNQVKTSAGIGGKGKLSDVTDVNRMVGVSNLMEKALGVSKGQGFDVALMLEKVQKKQMSQKQFDQKLKEMQDGQDPSVERLDKINNTLSGQTEILTNINNNLMEALGKEGVVGRNELTKGENEMLKGTKGAVGGVNNSGFTQGLGKIVTGAASATFGGGLGDSLGDWWSNRNNKDLDSDSAAAIKARKEDLMKQGKPVYQDINDKNQLDLSPATIDNFSKALAKSIKEAPINNQNTINTNVQLPDGKIHSRTTK